MKKCFIALIITILVISMISAFVYYHEFDAEYAIQKAMQFAREREPDVNFLENMFYIWPDNQSSDTWEVNIELPPESYEYKYRTEYIYIDKKTGRVTYSGYHDTAIKTKYYAYKEEGVEKRIMFGPERVSYEE